MACYSKARNVAVCFWFLSARRTSQFRIRESAGGWVLEEYYKICQVACNSAVNEYNKLAKEYNELLSITSVDFIENIDKEVRLKKEITYEQILACTEKMVLSVISIIADNTNELAEKYIIARQITNPDSFGICGFSYTKSNP